MRQVVQVGRTGGPTLAMQDVASQNTDFHLYPRVKNFRVSW